MSTFFPSLSFILRNLSFAGLLLVVVSAKVLATGFQGKMEAFHPPTGTNLNSITCMTLDKDGFLWFGTRNNGLIKYDGFKYESFLPVKSDPNSISGQSISSLACKGDSLIIGFRGFGLDIMDINQQIFHHVDEKLKLPHKHINSINILDRNHILLAFENDHSVYKLHLGDYALSKVNEAPPFENGELKDIVTNSGNHIWASIKRKAILHHNFNDSSTTYFDKRNSKLHSNVVDELIQLSDSLLIIATNVGLEVVRVNDNPEITSASLFRYPVSDFEVDVLLPDRSSKNVIWIGTNQGLYKFDLSTTEFIRIHSSSSADLKKNEISALFIDRSNMLWIATKKNGIFRYNTRMKQFNSWKNHELLRSTTENLCISDVFEDSRGWLWVGSMSNGLFQFDFEFDRVRHFSSLELSEKNAQDYISSIVELPNGEIWFSGKRNGIFKIGDIHDTSSVRSVPIAMLRKKTIRHMKSDHRGKLWIATKKNLVSYDINDGSSTEYKEKDGLSSRKLRHLYVAPDHKLWIGTEDGLNYLDLRTNEIKSFIHDPNDNNSLGGPQIRMIYQDKKGRIWIGTKRNGLNQFLPETNSFVKYPAFEDFNISTIYGVAEHEEYLWFSTNNGVVRFNATTGDISRFLKEDGLVDNEFEYNNSFETSSGRVFFGTCNGINTFHPAEIILNEQKPPVFITTVNTGNQNISYSPSDQKKKMILNYDQNDIKIEFCALDFSAPLENRYKYQLVNYDKEWSQVKGNNSVKYTNLNPGEYTFKIIASNNHSAWNFEGDELTIVVVAPWWQQPLWIMIFIFGLVIMLASIHQWLVFQKNKTNKLLRLVVDKKTYQLKIANNELSKKNEEIQAQNEELNSNYEEIMTQRDNMEEKNATLIKLQKSLDNVNQRLKNTNEGLEEEVKKRTLHLKKANDELDKFVYSASHDLSAPLKSIKGLLHLGKIDPEADPFKYYDMVSDSIERLEDVIKNLLHFSRNTSNKVTMETIKLHLYLEEVVKDLKYLNYNKNLEIKITGDKDVEIDVDSFRLNIVMQNLVSNAIKYSDPEKTQSFISIDFQLSDSRVIFTVSDNGIGMTAEQCERIFEMFYRATSRSSGSGLGMYIAREALEKMDGTIKVESTIEVGSTFIVTIPLSIAETDHELPIFSSSISEQ